MSEQKKVRGGNRLYRKAATIQRAVEDFSLIDDDDAIETKSGPIVKKMETNFCARLLQTGKCQYGNDCAQSHNEADRPLCTNKLCDSKECRNRHTKVATIGVPAVIVPDSKDIMKVKHVLTQNQVKYLARVFNTDVASGTVPHSHPVTATIRRYLRYYVANLVISGNEELGAIEEVAMPKIDEKNSIFIEFGGNKVFWGSTPVYCVGEPDKTSHHAANRKFHSLLDNHFCPRDVLIEGSKVGRAGLAIECSYVTKMSPYQFCELVGNFDVFYIAVSKYTEPVGTLFAGENKYRFLTHDTVQYTHDGQVSTEYPWHSRFIRGGLIAGNMCVKTDLIMSIGDWALYSCTTVQQLELRQPLTFSEALVSYDVMCMDPPPGMVEAKGYSLAGAVDLKMGGEINWQNYGEHMSFGDQSSIIVISKAMLSNLKMWCFGQQRDIDLYNVLMSKARFFYANHPSLTTESSLPACCLAAMRLSARSESGAFDSQCSSVDKFCWILEDTILMRTPEQCVNARLTAQKPPYGKVMALGLVMASTAWIVRRRTLRRTNDTLSLFSAIRDRWNGQDGGPTMPAIKSFLQSSVGTGRSSFQAIRTWLQEWFDANIGRTFDTGLKQHVIENGTVRGGLIGFLDIAVMGFKTTVRMLSGLHASVDHALYETLRNMHPDTMVDKMLNSFNKLCINLVKSVFKLAAEPILIGKFIWGCVVYGPGAFAEEWLKRNITGATFIIAFAEMIVRGPGDGLGLLYRLIMHGFFSILPFNIAVQLHTVHNILMGSKLSLFQHLPMWAQILITVAIVGTHIRQTRLQERYLQNVKELSAVNVTTCVTYEHPKTMTIPNVDLRVPLKPQNPATRITIDSYDEHKNRPAIVWGLVFLGAQGYCHNTNTLSEYEAIRNRAIVEQLPVDNTDIIKLKIFVNRNFKQLFRGLKVPRVPFSVWNRRFPAAQQRIHELTYRETCGGYPEEKDIRIKTFLKIEDTIQGIDSDMKVKAARVISGMTPHVNVAMGPECLGIAKTLVKAFDGSDKICYTAGWSAEAISEVLFGKRRQTDWSGDEELDQLHLDSIYLEQRNARDKIFQMYRFGLETDCSVWDGSITIPLLEFEQWVFQSWGHQSKRFVYSIDSCECLAVLPTVSNIERMAQDYQVWQRRQARIPCLIHSYMLSSLKNLESLNTSLSHWVTTLPLYQMTHDYCDCQLSQNWPTLDLGPSQFSTQAYLQKYPSVQHISGQQQMDPSLGQNPSESWPNLASHIQTCGVCLSMLLESLKACSTIPTTSLSFTKSYIGSCVMSIRKLMLQLSLKSTDHTSQRDMSARRIRMHFSLTFTEPHSKSSCQDSNRPCHITNCHVSLPTICSTTASVLTCCKDHLTGHGDPDPLEATIHFVLLDFQNTTLPYNNVAQAMPQKSKSNASKKARSGQRKPTGKRRIAQVKKAIIAAAGPAAKPSYNAPTANAEPKYKPPKAASASGAAKEWVDSEDNAMAAGLAYYNMITDPFSTPARGGWVGDIEIGTQEGQDIMKISAPPTILNATYNANYKFCCVGIEAKASDPVVMMTTLGNTGAMTLSSAGNPPSWSGLVSNANLLITRCVGLKINNFNAFQQRNGRAYVLPRWGAYQNGSVVYPANVTDITYNDDTMVYDAANMPEDFLLTVKNELIAGEDLYAPTASVSLNQNTSNMAFVLFVFDGVDGGDIQLNIAIDYEWVPYTNVATLYDPQTSENMESVLGRIATTIGESISKNAKASNVGLQWKSGVSVIKQLYGAGKTIWNTVKGAYSLVRPFVSKIRDWLGFATPAIRNAVLNKYLLFHAFVVKTHAEYGVGDINNYRRVLGHFFSGCHPRLIVQQLTPQEDAWFQLACIHANVDHCPHTMLLLSGKVTAQPAYMVSKANMPSPYNIQGGCLYCVSNRVADVVQSETDPDEMILVNISTQFFITGAMPPVGQCYVEGEVYDIDLILLTARHLIDVMRNNCGRRTMPCGYLLPHICVDTTQPIREVYGRWNGANMLSGPKLLLKQRNDNDDDEIKIPNVESGAVKVSNSFDISGKRNAFPTTATPAVSAFKATRPNDGSVSRLTSPSVTPRATRQE